jgi:hypothetical protein
MKLLEVYEEKYTETAPKHLDNVFYDTRSPFNAITDKDKWKSTFLMDILCNIVEGTFTNAVSAKMPWLTSFQSMAKTLGEQSTKAAVRAEVSLTVSSTRRDKKAEATPKIKAK